jgi:glycosyltransferase involved in cell wall biosynthesis
MRNSEAWPSYPEWFGDFDGEILDWSSIDSDILLIGDPPSFKILPEVRGNVLVWVIAGGDYIKQYQKVYGKYPFLLNNREFSLYFPRAYIVEGGVNTSLFNVKGRKLRVGYYAGRGAVKGEPEIIKKLKRVSTVQLVPIKGHDNYSMPFVYRDLDYFVTNEKRMGWANMVAEALACHCPVVAESGMNLDPFGDLIIRVDDMTAFFEDAMAQFSWERVVDRLQEVLKLSPFDNC